MIIVATTFNSKSQCSDIFISEYVEGWSNNRAIEIYNPTSNAIDLSAYTLYRFSNGNSSPSAQYQLQLSGTVQPKDVYVFVKDSSAGDYVWDSLYVKADAYLGPDYNINRTFFWNGNDAVAIFKGASPVDVIGKVGEDPAVLNGTSNSQDPNFGWPVGAAISWTNNHTLIRKDSIMDGQTNGTPTTFDPSIEWDSLPANTFDNLGFHDCACDASSVSEVVQNKLDFFVYPNPSNQQFVNVLVGADVKSITVYNLIGNIVYQKDTQGKLLNKVSTYNWNKGIYLVTVENNGGVKSTKKISITN